MKLQLKYELRDVISGKNQVRYGATIQAVARYLGDSPKAGPILEKSKQIKEQETKELVKFIENHNLWKRDINFTQYVSEGAEQKVFLKDESHVIKLNDGIYYSTWQDYFYSLLLHNFFFSDTAYELLGFCEENGSLYAVVQQPYVSVSQPTDLKLVKFFLDSNGFINTRNNDYLNPELGIILEDLHEENVLTQNEILYFIDTVFLFNQGFLGGQIDWGGHAYY